MPNLPLAHYFCANRFVRYLLESLDNVLVAGSLKVVLEQAHLPHLTDNYPPENTIKAFDFAHFAMLMLGLETYAGQESGRDIARQAGRHIMMTHARDFGDALTAADSPVFQALPLQTKLKIGIPAWINLHTDSLFYQPTLYDSGGNDILVTTERSPVCWGRHATSDVPVCALTVGVIEGGLIHITGGLEFEVTEDMCLAQGDDWCRFRIGTDPLASLTK